MLKKFSFDGFVYSKSGGASLCAGSSTASGTKDFKDLSLPFSPLKTALDSSFSPLWCNRQWRRPRLATLSRRYSPWN
jgi:hypothetical protein